MNLFTQNDFLYALAGLISTIGGIILSDITLTRKYKKLPTLLIWALASAAYFGTAYLGCHFAANVWWDYFVMLGWLVFVPIPALFLYKEHISTRIFTGVSAGFLISVTAFMTGITTTTLVGSIDPFGPEGYQFLIPFTLVKICIVSALVLLYRFLMRNKTVKLFETMDGKMTRFIAIPFAAGLGFFIIVQIVQGLGLLPSVPFMFISFYMVICACFGIMYWLIYSNATWSSIAIKTGAELSVASNIQRDMLPCIFPAFPERAEFDIHATMQPAKEVGGDFYDFFLVDDDHLSLVMADVSGKGVPAALFMVIAKTLLKNSVQNGLSPKAVLEKVNNQLCENNEAEMFVTVWLGIYEISTGKLTAANAGHEYPAIRKANGEFELFKDKHGFVLAGMEEAKYKEYELQLNAGDTLFVYTDGVAEATDATNVLYGTDRMLNSLNKEADVSPEELLRLLKEDVDKFVGKAPQFDDITMLGLKIN